MLIKVIFYILNMKIKCIKIINPHTDKEIKNDNFLTKGKEYEVIQIMISKNGKIDYKIIPDNNNWGGDYSFC
jgi:hypothetical protein